MRLITMKFEFSTLVVYFFDDKAYSESLLTRLVTRVDKMGDGIKIM